jgi:hypothetical protein
MAVGIAALVEDLWNMAAGCGTREDHIMKSFSACLVPPI